MSNTGPIDFKKFKFHPVIDLQNNFTVLDLSKYEKSAEPPVLSDTPTGRKYPSGSEAESKFTIGKYNEHRPSTYLQDLFDGRNIHVGVDIGAPLATPVFSFYEGEIFLMGDNQGSGDYGPTIVTRHQLDGTWLYALYGHLSRTSILDKKNGQAIKAGETIGFVGDHSENGGWPPHLHFQLSYQKPETANLPGVVAKKDLDWALKTFPDPRLVLGPIY